ncbi:M12 family metallo-peptidase [Halomarina oriensis]|uniref:Peptidase M10A and M12B matrixin and adamalysin n=1 Tax=Halomarina oriensis TaxID=671145 RepID=A0A6B0GFP3_9EURY|nr:peptidase M10A and M12B matrixin and adamalysin [Halomarina oriensis]MWG33642.1 peptidase M10A and M12B matrixin and adamalysin [Halomarina oriensis]
MRRRHVLLGLGAAGTVGVAGVASTLVGTIKLRWWATERAALYPGLRERVESYVERAFESLRISVDVSFGGTVSFRTENAYRLVVDGTWPRRLLTGTSGRRFDAVDGVNLLVTDGSMRNAPTGAGIPYVAAVGGAAEIVRAPPAEATDVVVPDRFSLRTIQVLLHECGHALGLRHDHGTIRTEEGAAIVSPMVSGYPWAPAAVRRAQFDYEESRCGDPYPPVRGKKPRLLLRFDECARTELARFRRPTGRPLPSESDGETDQSLSPAATCLRPCDAHR